MSHTRERSTRDESKILSMILNFRYPPLEQHPDFHPIPTVSPVTFYDKHIDERYQLKRVRQLSTLVKSVAMGFDKAFASYNCERRSFPVEDVCMLGYNELRFRNLMKDACSVGDIYEEAIAMPCSYVASILALHPNVPDYTSAFVWRKNISVQSQESFAADFYGLRMRRLETLGMKELFGLLDENTKNTVLELTKKVPRLAVWDIYALQGEDLVRRMEYPATLDVFPWQTCQMIGHTPPLALALAPLPDADVSANPWVLPIPDDFSTRDLDSGRPLASAGTMKTLRRSQRISDLQNTNNVSSAYVAKTKKSKKPNHEARYGERVYPPKLAGRQREATRPYVPDPIHFIQHAWSLAADADSTIIVFDCGNFQRIGVRHRESQTLYLSDLVDTRTCEDPQYGKLQAGIHLAIVKDALSRLPLLNDDEKSKSDDTDRVRKRHRSDEVPHFLKLKKRRRDDESNDDNIDVLAQSEEMISDYAPPALLLMYLKYRAYNSPVPASFIRMGPMLFPGEHHDAPTSKPKIKASYSSHDYLTLTLGPEIGYGAVGNVHKGELQRRMPDGRVAACGVVVKLAFLPEQQEKLSHEYSIYHHLYSSDVKGLGIVRVFGLFIDAEGGPSALVMSEGGQPLGYRQDGAGQVVVPPDERKAFLAALQSINNAGVRHNDLRSWNLLVDDRGGVSIIDFDSAELDPSVKEYGEEEDIMISLLDGKYVHP